ncbi:MAG: hypothetical protein CFH06_01751 [Alphaproteobacteria bacterium MarineAlpha3_Bin5]|nr:hypothetical protein [Magnetovibrio sp.]PPR76379.1 MAG: hypothetical protein CFH06_01751 [Alphaproteobacteria bacterium MarineAlpha3_Bin5]
MSELKLGVVRVLQKFRPGSLGIVFVLTTYLTGCSAIDRTMDNLQRGVIPDAINPASWYRSAADMLTGEDAPSDEREEEVSDNPNYVENENVGWWTIFGSEEPKNKRSAVRVKNRSNSENSFPKLSTVDNKVRRADNLNQGLVADPNRPKYAAAIARQGETTQGLAAQAPQPALIPGPNKTILPLTAGSQVIQNPQFSSSSGITSPQIASIAAGEANGMKERLSKHLAEIRARSTDQSNLLPNFSSIHGSGTLGTLVVSSSGVEVSSLSSHRGQNISPPGLPRDFVENKGALPLSPRSTKVATILFGSGSSGLGVREKEILADVSQLQKQTGGKVRVVGHSSQRTRDMDPVQHKMTNFRVSVKRANIVASELRRHGVDSEKILIAAVGDAQPIYFEVMPSGEAGNRRAEIYLDQ